MKTPAASLYRGEVMHRRLFPVRYRFAYRVYSLLLDIDRLDEAAAGTRLFSHNRPNLFAVHDRDHGPRDGSPLRPWIERILADHGIDLQGGRIALLCFPRVLGYVFNPLALWYCHGRDGQLRAVLCEVRNTFGEKHGYLLHEQGRPMAWPVRQQRDKQFHVSPFIGMQARYHFRLGEPDETLQVLIREFAPDDDGEMSLMLTAAQVGGRRPFTTGELLRAAVAIPFLTFKVMALIHWQALKIWLRGARFHRKPEPPAQEIS
ncbi:MAG: DUF1365 domain-containing protein [Gammaproteobacteria bacterium]|nr:DUF1365 domain-containing protein [Gammaproteobacteria bacterium]